MFEFLRMPFGLWNAGNTFQRMMDLVLGDLSFCFVYVDEILIFGKTFLYMSTTFERFFASVGNMFHDWPP